MIHRSDRYAPSRPEYNKIYELHLPNRRPAESACSHDAFARDDSGALHACFHSERTHRYPERYAPSRPEYNKIYELHLPNPRPTESACGHDGLRPQRFCPRRFGRPSRSADLTGGGIALFLFQVKVLGSAMSLPFPYGPRDP